MKLLSIFAALIALSGASCSAVAQLDTLETGRKSYESNCARCHESGIMGAPLVGDPEQWTAIDKETWRTVQVQHTEVGYLPSASKQAASPQDLGAAMEYIRSITH